MVPQSFILLFLSYYLKALFIKMAVTSKKDPLVGTSYWNWPRILVFLFHQNKLLRIFGFFNFHCESSVTLRIFNNHHFTKWSQPNLPQYFVSSASMDESLAWS